MFDILATLKQKNIILASGKINPHASKLIDDALAVQIENCTAFLPSDAPLLERLFYIKTNRQTTQTCKTCNKLVRYNISNKSMPIYCSKQCVHLDENVAQNKKTKTKKTNLQRYGVENVFAHPNIKRQIKNTILEKYGVEYASQHEEVKKKTEETNLLKYGYNTPLLHEDVKTKTDETNLLLYGTLFPSQADIIKNKIHNTFIVKYNGLANQQHISESCLRKLNDKTYLTKLHHEDSLTLTEIANILEVDTTTISNYFYKYNIPITRFPSSSMEREMHQWLTENGIIFETNNRTFIAPYEIDVIIHDKKIAIELCGVYWHNELHVDKGYHEKKRELVQRRGYQLLTIFEDEFIYKKDIVYKTIAHKLNLSKDKIFARKTEPGVISKECKQTFLDKHHIQGNGDSTIDVALWFNDEPVAVMAFLKNGDKFILNRYATSIHVVGGFSKLLNYAIAQFNIKKIETFADLRWSIGEVYSNNGFTLTNIISPNYKYVMGDRTYHRSLFRKQFLTKRIPNYDTTLTEHENCFNNRIYRIYDCGLLKFEKICSNS